MLRFRFNFLYIVHKIDLILILTFELFLLFISNNTLWLYNIIK
jgi:hypothetical protein